MSVDEILKKAEALSAEDRAKLVDCLLISLRLPHAMAGSAHTDDIELAQNRLAELKSGTAESVPMDAFLDDVRRRFPV